MANDRRFVFHGAAAVFGGHVYRPKSAACVLPSPASAALPVTGGYSRAELGTKQRRLTPWLRFGHAVAVAEGACTDKKLALEMSLHKLAADQVPTATRVSAVITDFDLRLDGHTLAATTLRGTLEGSSPTDRVSGTPVSLGRDTTVKGLQLDGHAIRVTIDHTLFAERSTFDALFDRIGRSGANASGPVLTSVVTKLEWVKKPHPTATIEGHVISVPNFGKLIFGEILVTRDARRLTLLRLALGSPTGLDASAIDVHTDGSWYPP